MGNKTEFRTMYYFTYSFQGKSLIGDEQRHKKSMEMSHADFWVMNSPAERAAIAKVLRQNKNRTEAGESELVVLNMK